MLISYISTLNCSKNEFFKKEEFKNTVLNDGGKQDNTEIEGDCYNVLNRNKLYTTSAVNIPGCNDSTSEVFKTCKNYKDNASNVLTGKYCFPIEKLLYDGVWDGNVENINNKSSEEQTRKWTIADSVKTHGLYCGEQLLKLPEKTLGVGDEVILSDECAKFYPKPAEVEEKIRQCTMLNTCRDETCFDKTGLIELNNGKWHLDGL
jgi:hypothetical protein